MRQSLQIIAKRLWNMVSECNVRRWRAQKDHLCFRCTVIIFCIKIKFGVQKVFFQTWVLKKRGSSYIRVIVKPSFDRHNTVLNFRLNMVLDESCHNQSHMNLCFRKFFLLMTVLPCNNNMNVWFLNCSYFSQVKGMASHVNKIFLFRSFSFVL